MASPNMQKIQKEREETKRSLKPRLLHPSPKGSEPLNLGIQEFKRSRKRGTKMLVKGKFIKQFKEEQWRK